MHLVENDLLQEVQPDIVSGRAFTQPRIMVLATEKLDVVVILIKVEVQIAAALGTLHHAGKNAWLLGDGRALAPCPGFQRLYLFPSRPINDGLVNIEEDRPVFLRVFDPLFHLVGFGVAFEVDTINNLASSITGMICDGGNQGCTMKGIVAVDAAWQAVSLAEKQAYIYNVHGINGATPEQTMRNMGLIASPGMVGTEKTIVEILQDKQAKE